MLSPEDYAAAMRTDIRNGMPAKVVRAYANRHLTALLKLPEGAERDRAITDLQRFLAELRQQ